MIPTTTGGRRFVGGLVIVLALLLVWGFLSSDQFVRVLGPIVGP